MASRHREPEGPPSPAQAQLWLEGFVGGLTLTAPVDRELLRRAGWLQRLNLVSVQPITSSRAEVKLTGAGYSYLGRSPPAKN